MCLKCDDDEKAFEDEVKHQEMFWCMLARYKDQQRIEEAQKQQRIDEVLARRFDGRESER